MVNLKLLGNNIQSKRKQKKFNQEELAYRVGISRNYLSLVETGMREISLSNLVAIADALDTTVTELLTGNQNIHDCRFVMQYAFFCPAPVACLNLQKTCFFTTEI